MLPADQPRRRVRFFPATALACSCSTRSLRLNLRHQPSSTPTLGPLDSSFSLRGADRGTSPAAAATPTRPRRRFPAWLQLQPRQLCDRALLPSAVSGQPAHRTPPPGCTDLGVLMKPYLGPPLTPSSASLRESHLKAEPVQRGCREVGSPRHCGSLPSSLPAATDLSLKPPHGILLLPNSPRPTSRQGSLAVDSRLPHFPTFLNQLRTPSRTGLRPHSALSRPDSPNWENPTLGLLSAVLLG